MYRYNSIDQTIVQERVNQYRDQLARFFAGELSEEEFRPLRLQNGLYIQRHAPMLRVAVPYGLLSATQLRALAQISEQYDKGYAHFTTRQNVQFNWPKLEDTADILQVLADVEMHAIQTSGACVRNITTDEFAGVAADEYADPRPFCEILRQWSTFHPEFAALPRKFKIAMCASREDRSVTFAHDIGLFLLKNSAGELGFRVSVGGGLGRTPMIGSTVREFLPWPHMMSYCEAILRVYNRHGRRDNLYKARIKILLKALGLEEFTRQVEAEFAHLQNGPATLTQAELDRVSAYFSEPAYEDLNNIDFSQVEYADNIAFTRWRERNTRAHKRTGYTSVVLSFKANDIAPGDATTAQMRVTADLAERYSFGELRVSHEQNLILADVPQKHLLDVWKILKDNGMATPNVGLLTDIIACPGGDFCSLANARSIPIANQIQARFDDWDYLHDLGEIQLNISGCMNSCGHHHVANIGVLGVDKNNEEWYQITIGGQQGNDAAIGKVIGLLFSAGEVADVVEALVNVYVEQRTPSERFIDTFHRLGIEPFKERAYAGRDRKKPAATPHAQGAIHE